MKPKDLKFPFTWEERKPLIFDKVLFVPKFYDGHGQWSFPGWEDKQIFESSKPLQIEYCSGNGAWIIERAKTHPDLNWIAVEKRFDRVQKIWSKMKNEKLDNLFIVCGEALAFTTYYVADESFHGIFINFPDPWPKGKHTKHRLLKENFITQIARASKKEAKAVIVTDHEEYSGQMCKAFVKHPAWTAVFPEPYFITEWEGYGTSYFDELWRHKGKTIHYMQFSNGKTL